MREAMDKDEEMQRMNLEWRLSREQQTGTIGELQNQLSEKTLQMSLLEARMVALAHQGAGADNLMRMMERMRKDYGDRNFELQVMRADNRMLQDTVEMLQRDNASLDDTAASASGYAFRSVG